MADKKSKTSAAPVQQTYNVKTFNRDYEKTFGNLKPEQFPPIDWADRAQIELLLPEYRRNYLKMMADTKTKVSRIVELDNFSLKTPDNERYLFKNSRLYIEPHKRCAVYGTNGVGKTTLFEAINKQEVKGFPDWMHVHHMKELEHNKKADKVGVLDTVLNAHKLRRVLLAMEEGLTKLVAKESDEDRKEKLTKNLEYVKFELKRISSDTGPKRASGMLRVLGFDEVGEKAPLSSLSGGLRMRVALASAFFIDPELLLLDEPTNHLDMPSVLWLENRLRGYKGSYLLVTHDRTLLENVVTSVMLMQDEEISYFACGFKEFESRKKKLDQDRDEMIDKFLKRNRNVDPSTPLYRKKKNYQDWQNKRHERKMLLSSKFTFKDPKPLKCDAGVEQKDISLIKVEGVRFSYDVKKGLPFIFDTPISYNVKLGTRVGIMGPNGAGKSTLLKLITGKIKPTEGKIITNPDFTLAYFGQHSTKDLKLDYTPIEYMVESFPDAKQGLLSNHLAKTSVASAAANTRMKNLSYSQRSCVIFAKLTFVPPHLLIMDEPTNFLDLESVDSLIKAARNFKGGLICVTHNRDFLKKCGRDFLSIVPGAFLEFPSFKDAERATYSFISAMEKGEQIDVKNAILNNRGGGAVHTEEDQKKRQKKLITQQTDEQKRVAAIAAKKAEEAKIAAAKAAKIAAKKAAIKTDWVAGDKCWAHIKKEQYKQGVVKQNIPGMGVTVVFPGGKATMFNASKLKVEHPHGGEKAPAARGGGRGRRPSGRGGGRGRGKSRGRGGGQRGQRAGGRGQRSGGRGSRGRGRRGGRGA